jgi:hypothetical protein
LRDGPTLAGLRDAALTAMADTKMSGWDRDTVVLRYVAANRAAGRIDAQAARDLGITSSALGARMSLARSKGHPDAVPTVKPMTTKTGKRVEVGSMGHAGSTVIRYAAGSGGAPVTDALVTGAPVTDAAELTPEPASTEPGTGREPAPAATPPEPEPAPEPTEPADPADEPGASPAVPLDPPPASTEPEGEPAPPLDPQPASTEPEQFDHYTVEVVEEDAPEGPANALNAPETPAASQGGQTGPDAAAATTEAISGLRADVHALADLLAESRPVPAPQAAPVELADPLALLAAVLTETGVAVDMTTLRRARARLADYGWTLRLEGRV